MNKSRATLIVAVFVAALSCPSLAQDSKAAPPNPAKPPSTAREEQPGREYSGMYSFLNEGEFVQITVEDEGRVTGFRSEEHTSELQSHLNLVCRLLLEKKRNAARIPVASARWLEAT